MMLSRLLIDLSHCLQPATSGSAGTCTSIGLRLPPRLQAAYGYCHCHEAIGWNKDEAIRCKGALLLSVLLNMLASQPVSSVIFSVDADDRLWVQQHWKQASSPAKLATLMIGLQC